MTGYLVSVYLNTTSPLSCALHTTKLQMLHVTCGKFVLKLDPYKYHNLSGSDLKRNLLSRMIRTPFLPYIQKVSSIIIMIPRPCLWTCTSQPGGSTPASSRPQCTLPPSPPETATLSGGRTPTWQARGPWSREKTPSLGYTREGRWCSWRGEKEL